MFWATVLVYGLVMVVSAVVVVLGVRDMWRLR